MKVIDELRPAEALFLLSQAGQELMNDANVLAAVLAGLASKEYIVLQDENVHVTGKHKSQAATLRHYEVKCVEAMDDGNVKSLYQVTGFDFGELLAREGFFETEKKGDDTVYKPTEKSDQALIELNELKKRISSTAEQKSQDKYLTSMSYAFPSIGKSDGFWAYAKKFLSTFTNSLMHVEATLVAANVAIA